MDTSKTNIVDALSATTDASTGIDPKQVLQGSSSAAGARFYCDALYDDSINSVIEDTTPYLVTLVGFSEFGKSTFVASLYHMLMACGEIAGYKFVDSDTFSGFERRAHVRNIQIRTSKRYIHTSSNEGNFLTLLLEKNGVLRKLIISDKAGEIYRNNYSNNLEEVKKDNALINSKHIVFFLDSKSLFDDVENMAFEDRFYNMLSRFKQAGVFDSSKKLDIIYNKFDLCTKDNMEAFDKARDTIEKRIQNTSGLELNRIFKICSNRMADNKELSDVFEYFVNLFDDSNITNKNECDWTQKYL